MSSRLLAERLAAAGDFDGFGAPSSKEELFSAANPWEAMMSDARAHIL